MAFFQKPESGVTETSKMVRSLGLGKSIWATFPPSSSAMSVIIDWLVGVIILCGEWFSVVVLVLSL